MENDLTAIWNMRSTVYSLRYRSAVNACLPISSYWFFITDEVKVMEMENEGALLKFGEKCLSSGTEVEGELSQGTCKESAMAAYGTFFSLQSCLRVGAQRPREADKVLEEQIRENNQICFLILS